MRFFAFFLLFLVAGCAPVTSDGPANQWVALPDLGKTLIETMASKNTRVQKTFTLNNKSETKQLSGTDSAFWASELEWLLSTDLNSPQLWDILEAKAPIQDSHSNLTILQIRPKKDTAAEIAELSVKYLKEIDDIREIHLVMATKNYIATGKKALSLYMNRYAGELLIDSLVVSGEDKVLFQEKRRYHSITKRIN